MKNAVAIISLCLALTGCAVQSAIPLGNDMMQIDVSAAPVYGRAGAQRMAFEKAAEATVEAGYDKFIVVGNQGWNENTISGGSYGSISGNSNSFSGSSGSGFSSHRHPEATMVIHMYKRGEKGSAKAIDAHAILAKKAKEVSAKPTNNN